MTTLYLNEQQSIVKKRDEYLIVSYPDKRKMEIPLIHVSQVVVSGDITLTTPALHALLERGIDVSFLSLYGHFRGKLLPPIAKNAAIRDAQYHAHRESQQALQIAQACVRGKLANMRTILLRSQRQTTNDQLATAAQEIQSMIQRIPQTTTVGSLLGIEGKGSAAYFHVFGQLLREPFQFTLRRRRPPTDPINALLSLGYTVLGHQVSSAIQVVGLDPYTGFLHQTRHGRPALALDLMEEFRPIIVDSIVLNLCNHHLLTTKDFDEELGVVYLKPDARKKFYSKFEERLQEEIYHPSFEYRTSYRRCLELQVRLLGKYLMNEIPSYPPFMIR
jgi:CRISPR-associated endonuclease Cas1